VGEPAFLCPATRGGGIADEQGATGHGERLAAAAGWPDQNRGRGRGSMPLELAPYPSPPGASLRGEIPQAFQAVFFLNLKGAPPLTPSLSPPPRRGEGRGEGGADDPGFMDRE
jgi:hypothetical protein